MLNRVLNEMPSTVSAELLLPKFRLSYGKELNDHLKSMGLRTAFSERADFRRISTGPLYINKVIHKAIIEVMSSKIRNILEIISYALQRSWKLLQACSESSSKNCSDHVGNHP